MKNAKKVLLFAVVTIIAAVLTGCFQEDERTCELNTTASESTEKVTETTTAKSEAAAESTTTAATTKSADKTPMSEDLPEDLFLHMANGGMAATDGEWVYYSFDDSFGVSHFFKARLDGSEEQYFMPNVNADFITVIDDWVYCLFSEYDDSAELIQDGIFRISTDGSKKEYLFDSDLLFEAFSDEDLKSKLTNETDGWIYYNDENENRWSDIYKRKTDDEFEEGQLVYSFEQAVCSEPCIVGDWIYVKIASPASRLYYGGVRISLDGKDCVELGGNLIYTP